MKKYSIYLAGAFLFMNGLALTAQNHFNIRLEANAESPASQVCYDVQLASADAADFNLAGQNYRMYYDASKLEYDDQTSRVLLPREKYTNLTIKDNVQDIDASSAGPLAFDNHLSFLNIGNDLKDELNGGIILPASGEWVSTANICFNVRNESLSKEYYGIFWAREELTQSYATAFVEVAEWIKPEVTVASKAAIFFDEELNTSIDDQLWDQVPSVYPNPTKDRVFIDYEGEEELLVQVYGSTGQLVLEDRYPANASNHSIQLGNLAAGIYQVRLSSKDKQLVKRIEKIH